jgi:ABC-2 type transport system permease protein
VTQLVRAELLKLRTTRTFWAIGGSMLALLLLTLVLTLALTDRFSEDDSLSALSSAGFAGLLALVLGVVSSAGEYRHGTIASTLLTTPDRLRVAGGQALAGAIFGLGIGLVAVGVTMAIGLPWLELKDAPIPPGDELLDLIVGNLLYAALAGAFGMAVGALLRNQVAAVVLVLVILFVVDPSIGALLPDYAQYSLTGLSTAMSGGSADDVGAADLLPLWQAALLWCAYTAVLVGAAALLTARRDI